MDKIEQTFTQFLKDDSQLDYPDFDAMWNRLEQQLANPDAMLELVDKTPPKRRSLRKAVAISVLAAVLVATPVIAAAISHNWDNLLSYRSGIQSALQQGLGQSIEKSVTHEGLTLTVHTAIVDDNRTVLLYSLSMENGLINSFSFSKMNLQDGQGRVIEGRQSQSWDEKSKVWNGYFETEWTPDNLETDVRFTAQKLQSFSSVERDISFTPLDAKKQIYTIQQDGIDQLAVQPFVQGDNMMLAYEVSFDQNDAKQWAYPRISVSTDNMNVMETGTSVSGKPGEHGEYTGQQFFRTSDLQQDSVKYKLLYTKEEKRIDKDWTYDLHLDKKQMLSGTVKRDLKIPIEHLGQQMVLEQMIVTPTQIRIKTSHEKYKNFPFLNYTLEVNGAVLKGGIGGMRENPEESTFRFEVPAGVQVNGQMPVTFVAKHEVVEHKEHKEPIQLNDISEEKKTVTTLIGGYSVTWIYYKRDGNLFVQSESTDPSFGGINQTYMQYGEQIAVGKQVTTNFSGDGNNQAIDMYANFSKTEAELHIFWYTTEDPHKQLRVDLNE